MASCKDCLHVEACEFYAGPLNAEPCVKYAESCECFKDRNRFVELPCKVGDTLYEICARRKGGKWKPVIIERTVQRIEVGSSDCVTVRCGKTIVLFSFDFGKNVFLTREEAERALKERENND